MDIRSCMFGARHKDAIVHYPTLQPASIDGFIAMALITTAEMYVSETRPTPATRLGSVQCLLW